MKLITFVFISALLMLIPPTASWADQVEVAGGAIEGTKTESGIRLFKGIPFAAPPVGERRWKAPAPVEPWEGVRKADEWESHCMQGEM